MARIIRPKFANLNNLFNATKMPPRMYRIVAMRKYAPIAMKGNAGPPAPPGPLVPVTFVGGGLTGCGLIIGPKKSASGA